MSAIAVVIGRGPNEVEIPLLVFPSVLEARSYIAAIPGLIPKSSTAWQLPERIEEGSEVAQRLFKYGDYYGGCGECWGICIRESNYGQPLVGWNLD